MKFRYALAMSAILLLLAACSQEKTPATGTAPAPAAAETSPEATPATAETPATTQETTPAAEPTTPAPAPKAPAGPPLVAGTDYIVIDGGQPYEPLDGKIEVTEFFGYVCPGCNQLAPQIRLWKRQQPADVRVTYVPVEFGPEWLPYAKAYHAAATLGIVDKSHDAVFRAIHVEKSLPGEGMKPDEQAIARFYSQYGVSQQEFTDMMNSFAISGKLNRAKQFAVRSKIQSTPSLVVNGKYLVKGSSWDDMLRIADALIARERAAGAGQATAQ